MNIIKNHFIALLCGFNTLTLSGQVNAFIIDYDYEAVVTSVSNNSFGIPLMLDTKITGRFSINTLGNDIGGGAFLTYGITGSNGPATTFGNTTFGSTPVSHSTISGSMRTTNPASLSSLDSNFTPVTSDPYLGASFAREQTIQNYNPGAGSDIWEMKLAFFETDGLSLEGDAVIGWKLVDPTGTAFAVPATPDPVIGYYPILSLDLFETATLTIDMTQIGIYSIWADRTGRSFSTTEGVTPGDWRNYEARITALTTSVDGVLISSVPLPGAFSLMLIAISGLGGSLLFDRRRQNLSKS